MRKFAVAFFAVLIGAQATTALSRSESDMNALLVVESRTEAFNSDFQKYLADNGARIIRAFPPHAFMGYVPAALDKTLGRKYGAAVYRARIEELNQLAGYGESVIYAVNVWNKRFVEDPPEAPLVISHQVRQAKKGGVIVLSWNSVMKAVEYRIEISRDADSNEVVLRASLEQNRYELYPAFFADGVYYWRVAALLTLNNGERAQSRFSDAYSFAVSKPAAPGASAAAAKLPKTLALKGGKPLAWEKNPAFKYYRVQLAETKDFSDLIADGFTDTNSYKTAGLPLEYGATYYLRLMGAVGSVSGTWSEACEVRVDKQ
ncbi:MAG: hypothetical protein HY796_04920 [Elusimicrobia bacterium]|nr:hypothetical protein [Elusimicrobiota bacterium]